MIYLIIDFSHSKVNLGMSIVRGENMRIVLLGNADSLWMKEYIENILFFDGVEIIIISRENTLFREWYNEQNIEVFTCGTGILNNFPIAYNWICFNKSVCKKIGRFDVLHVQYLDIVLLVRCIWLIAYAKETIYTYWGSDLLRSSRLSKILFYPFLKKAKFITLMSNEMKKKFNIIYKNRLNYNSIVLDFGNPGYKMIRQYAKKMTKDQCKKYWRIDESQFVVPIGYNAIPEQQHIKIIEQLGKVPYFILKKYTFILHFGYGNTDEKYLSEIRNAVKGYRLNCVIIDRFLNMNEIAILRLCADAFLYGQTTDALSGSVLEYLYAGSILVKPSWLDYSILDNMNIHYIEYNEFDEIPDIMCSLYTYSIENTDNIRQKLWEFNSWEALLSKWRELYLD